MIKRSKMPGGRGRSKSRAIFVVCALMLVGPLSATSASAEEPRGYELVTPPDTLGIAITPGTNRIMQDGDVQQLIHTGSDDGNRLAFGSGSNPLPGYPASITGISFLAQRGAGGWNTIYTGTPGRKYDGGPTSYVLSSWARDFSRTSTYSRTRLNPADPGGADGQFDGFREDIFAQNFADYGTDAYEWVSRSAVARQDGGDYRITPITSSDDDTVNLFKSPVPLTPAAEAVGEGQVYVNGASGAQLVSEYSDGTAARSTQVNTARLDAEGRTAAFLAAASPSDPTSHLFVRLLRDDETVDVGPADGALILARNGRSVTFASSSQVTSDDHDTSIDLFRYNVGSRSLERLTKPAAAQGDLGDTDACSSSPDPRFAGCAASEVITSPDGSTTFFLSPERLAGPSGASGPQQDGANLYAVRDTGGPRYVATLSAADLVSRDAFTGYTGILEDGPARRPVRTTEDGDEMVFESDSASPATGGSTQVFSYGFASDRLSCPSCGSGSFTASSPAALKSAPRGRNNPPAGAGRNISDDGSSIVFDSASRLAPGDINGTTDVYEYSLTTGAVSLVSSGKGDGSFYIDSSADARDVFFQTTDSLVASDRNGPVNKIYDARRGGGFPSAPSTAEPCTGSGCRGGGTTPTAPPATSTASPSPSGNAIVGRRVSVAIAGPTRAERLRASRTGRISVKVRSSRSGVVRVKLFSVVGKKVREVGSRSVRVRAGRRTSVTLTLSRSARSVLKERGSLRVRAEASAAGARVREARFTIEERGSR